jgi:hypothetical protein
MRLDPDKLTISKCRYPEYRVPPHTSSKSTQRAARASTCCHVSCSFRPHLPAEVSSYAITCPAAPDLASLLKRAPALPRVPQLRNSLPCRGGLRRFYVSHCCGLCFPKGKTSVLSRLPRPPVVCGPQK